MTTPSVDREPVSVEPMTPIRALATMRRWADHMRAENAILQTRSGVIISADVIDAVLSVVANAHSRALPLPRRYPGGELADGLYLVTRPDNDAGGWHTLWSGPPQSLTTQFRFAQVDGAIREAGFVWLIGPITIPDLPSEEASP